MTQKDFKLKKLRKWFNELPEQEYYILLPPLPRKTKKITQGTLYSDKDNNQWMFNGKEWKLLNWSGKGQFYIKNKP